MTSNPRRLLLALWTTSLLTLTGCAQITGHVHGDRILDLHPERADATTCQVAFVDREAPAGYSSLGVLEVEGPTWMTREDIEDFARTKACEAGAEVAVVSRELYGAQFLGSSAQVELFWR